MIVQGNIPLDFFEQYITADVQPERIQPDGVDFNPETSAPKILPITQDFGINLPLVAPVVSPVPFDGVHTLPEVVVTSTKKKTSISTCCCFSFLLFVLFLLFKNKTFKSKR